MSPAVPRSRRPLARRVRLALLAVGAVCVAVTAGVFYTLWSQQMLELRVSELARQVGVVASGVAVSDTLPGSEGDVDHSRERLLKVEAGLLGVRFAVIDASGTVLFSTAGVSAATSYPVDTFIRGADTFAPRTAVLEFADVGRVAAAAVPVAFASADRPTRYLVGVRTLSELGATDRYVGIAIGAGIAAGLLVAVLLGGWLTSRIAGPLVRLTEGARAVTAGEWGRQVSSEGDDEVTELARAFNEMSVRVADTYRAQQEFVGDVSHELRTPVTSIRGFADAIVDGTVADDEGVKRAASIISNEASRLAELTTTLLALADLDAGGVTIERGPVDAEALIDALRVRFAGAVHDAGVRLEFESDRARPLGDSARVLQAASALVENAVRHVPFGGRVRVRAAAAGGRWHLEVDDDGPGVPEGDRERIFGRFTRLDAARRDGGGTGLGLAICRRLVTLMGGRVWAEESTDLGGARFVLELASADGAVTAASTRTQYADNARPTPEADSHRRIGSDVAPQDPEKESSR